MIRNIFINQVQRRHSQYRGRTHHGAIDSKGTIPKLLDPVTNLNSYSFSAPLDGWRGISSDFTIQHGIATQGLNSAGVIIPFEDWRLLKNKRWQRNSRVKIKCA